MKILLIEPYDFEGFPTGGTGTLCDQLVRSFGEDVALVGITTSASVMVRNWGKKKINGTEHDFYAVKHVKKLINKKPLIPARLTWYMTLRRCQKDILNYGCSNVFTQSPDTLLAISEWGIGNICFTFAGLNNPLSMSRFKWARIFSQIFEALFISKLKHVNTLLAAASKEEIEKYSNKIICHGIDKKINQFPTKVDIDIFHPMDAKNDLRNELGFRLRDRIIIASGRLSEVKGWKLLLESYKLFVKECPDSILLFIGDGQDKPKIESFVKDMGIQRNVKLVGVLPKEDLARYLNISDLYVMGSFFEGWPTSIIEALACGIPICSTNFRSAYEIINNEKIGIIVEDRNPANFAECMKRALEIQFDKQFCQKETAKYSAANLKDELCKYWIL